MAAVYYIGNAATIAQIVTGTVTAVALGGTLSATINGKTVTYTCTGTDTATTAVLAWIALLQAALSPEFQEEVWSAGTNVLTVTSTVPGQPFTVLLTAAGGASITQATTQANVSPSDAGDANNWSRNGSPGLPQNADDIVFQNCTVPVLWNLNAISFIRPASVTRYQSHTGQIGLSTTNVAGYLEYRPTYLQFSGTNGGTLRVTLGLGNGSGPPLEQYDIQDTGQTNDVDVLAGTDVRFNCNTVNQFILSATNANVSVAVENGQVSKLATVQVDGNGTLTLGAGCVLTGSIVQVNNATLNLYAQSVPTTINATASTVNCYSLGQTYPTIICDTTTINWLSNSNVTTLTMENNSVFDHSQDWRNLTITNCTLDGSCQINDPLNTITMTNAFAFNSASQSGPLIFGRGRNVKVS